MPVFWEIYIRFLHCLLWMLLKHGRCSKRQWCFIVYNLGDNVFHTTLGMWYGVYIYITWSMWQISFNFNSLINDKARCRHFLLVHGTNLCQLTLKIILIPTGIWTDSDNYRVWITRKCRNLGITQLCASVYMRECVN